MTKSLEVLLLDDEPIVGRRLKPALDKIGCRVEVFENPKEAVARIDQKEFDIVVTDIRMEEMDGIQVLEHVQKKWPRTKVIIITGYAKMDLAREAMGKGVFDFIAAVVIKVAELTVHIFYIFFQRSTGRFSQFT